MTLEQSANLGLLAPLHQAGRISTGFVADQLGLSVQHVRRLLNGSNPRVKRKAWNRLDDEVRSFVIATKKDEPTYNCQWLSEITSDRFGHSVSQSSVYRILKAEHLLVAPPIKRHLHTRFEALGSGDLVQMDTTWGYWWQGKKVCLIVLLDDHSRFILAGRLVEHDSAWNNLDMIREVVAQYGSFRLLYTDNASFFKAIRHNQSQYQIHHQTEYDSQISKACREAGITHLTHRPYQPQSKGKIERLFRFIQERFVPEIETGMTLAEINAKLAVWMDWYNTKHVNRSTKQTPKERFNPKGFQPLSGEKCLDDIFCFKDTRKVDKCNQFSYHGQVYTIPKQKCMVAFKVGLHIIPDRSIRVWHNNQLVCQLPIQK